MRDSTDARSERPANPGWQAESWRLTAFVETGSQVAEPNWWTALVGEPPETRVSNPRQGLLQEQGAYEGGTLILGVQPGRIDWHFTATPSQQDVPTAPASLLGSPSESMGPFRPLAVRWFELSPPIIRLAVGGVLLQPVDRREAAYRVITSYVPGLNLESPDCSDFLYQINRPRSSTVHPGFRINRLTKWSAAATMLLQVTLPAPIPLSQQELYVTARLELDINTAADFTSELSRSELPALFDELVKFGLEITERGDVP